MRKTYFIFIYALTFIFSSCAQFKVDELQRVPAAEDKTCTALVENFFANEKERLEYEKYLREKPARDALQVIERAKKANEDAAAIFKELGPKASKLYPTSGFKSSKMLREKLQNSTYGAKKAAQVLLDEEVEVTMAVPDEAREGIVRRGFLNFRESKKSNGVMDNRELVEANYSGIDVDDFFKISKGAKPKFAYLAPAPETGLLPPMGAEFFGPDRFVFNLDKIRKRMTFTIGDSLNRHVIHTSATDHEAKTWDQFYMPWEYRELIAPAIAKNVEENKLLAVPFGDRTFSASINEIENNYPKIERHRFKNLEKINHENPDQKTKWEDLKGEIDPPEDLKDYKISWGTSHDFIELQIWGDLTLDDVKIFEYGTKAPEGEFLKALQDRGIEIRERKK